jgi:hypothetical protein
MQNHITDLLAEIADLHQDLDSHDPEHDEGHEYRATARSLFATYKDLIDALELRAYPVDDSACGRLEQVVITVYGVDLSIRGRTGEPGDLFVHIDTDDRDQDDAARFPLTVEVDNGGEMTYGDAY